MVSIRAWVGVGCRQISRHPTARWNLSIVRRLSAMASSRFIATNNATLIISHATPPASRAQIIALSFDFGILRSGHQLLDDLIPHVIDDIGSAV
jgi:hypothetical protein